MLALVAMLKVTAIQTKAILYSDQLFELRVNSNSKWSKYGRFPLTIMGSKRPKYLMRVKNEHTQRVSSTDLLYSSSYLRPTPHCTSNISKMDEESFTYLTSNTMATISSTLALAANVTSFDCTELWTLDSSGNYYCPYVYATSQLQTRCPHLLTGHHPRDKIDHVLSPKVRHHFV